MLTVSGRVEAGSLLSKLCDCSSSEREALLNSSAHLDAIYERAALRGSTSSPPAQDEVDLHYVCFIKSPNGSVYEMDGDASGPVKTDITLEQDEDMLEMSALKCVKRCVAREDADGKFSLLALVQDSSTSNQTHWTFQHAPVSFLIAPVVADIKYALVCDRPRLPI